MKIEEALADIVPVKPITYVMEKVKEGQISVLDDDIDTNPTIRKCQDKIRYYKKLIDDCKSDAEYWYLLGQLTYWKMAENIVLAAELNNGELADVPKPTTTNVMVMMAIDNMEQYGVRVYNETNSNLRKKKKDEK